MATRYQSRKTCDFLSDLIRKNLEQPALILLNVGANVNCVTEYYDHLRDHKVPALWFDYKGPLGGK